MGKAANVKNEIIALKFLQHLPVGIKLFSEKEELNKQGMSDSDLTAIFDATNDRLSQKKQKTTEVTGTDSGLHLAVEPKPMPKWANDLQARVSALQARLDLTAMDEGVMEEKIFIAKVKKHGKTCSICGKTNHTEPNCFKRVCSKCSRKGHNEDTCTSTRRLGGHRSKDCKFPGVLKVNNREFKVVFLLDTGARTSIMSVHRWVRGISERCRQQTGYWETYGMFLHSRLCP